MAKFKVNIYITHTLGGFELTFLKTFWLPFAPFYDMVLFEHNDEMDENSVELRNHQYRSTTIYWYNKDNCFNVFIRNKWPNDPYEGIVDETMDHFKSFGWSLYGNTDIEKIKKFIKDG